MRLRKFNFATFLKATGLTSKDFAEKTGLGINTLTKWKTLTTDEKIHQESILKLLVAFPDIDLKKYFPAHAKIISLSTKQDTKSNAKKDTKSTPNRKPKAKTTKLRETHSKKEDK